MRLFLIFTTLLLFLNACSSKKKMTYKKPLKKQTTQKVETTTDEKKVNDVTKSVIGLKKNTNPYVKNTTLDYIKKYAPLAMDEMRKFKIPASITLAQGILESGNGNSELAKKSNNHFGIKCHKGWKKARVYHDDDAKGECFRKYKYPSTSYQDHSLFLTTRFRYASLFKIKKGDYKAWAKGLKKAGYATDPKYADKLIKYIEKYKLYQYDQLVLKGIKKLYDKPKPIKKEIKNTVKDLKKESKRRIYIVKSDDTLYAISKKQNISIEALKALNDLPDNTIHKGDVLKLWENPIKDNHHLVKKKETLYSIAKKYNLSVNQLKKINNLKSNELLIGQKLKIIVSE